MDISREGCRIRSAGAVPSEKYFQAEIELEEPAERLTVNLAVMRWARQEEFGIEFIRMEPESQAQLWRIIRNREEATARRIVVRTAGSRSVKAAREHRVMRDHGRSGCGRSAQVVYQRQP